MHSRLQALHAAAPAAAGLWDLLPLVGMIAVFWFLILGPMRKQEKERRRRLEGIKRGDQVVIGGGILGRISNLDDTVATVEIADKVKVRVLRKEISDTQEAAIEAAKSDKKSGGKDKGGDEGGSKEGTDKGAQAKANAKANDKAKDKDKDKDGAQDAKRK